MCSLLVMLATPLGVRAQANSQLAVCLQNGSCERLPGSFDGTDWFASVLLADAAFAVGMLAGGAVGAATVRDCPDGTAGFSDGCSFDALGRAAILATAFGTTSAATAIYAYGEARGHDGSYLATLGGTSLGTLAAYGLIALGDDGESEAAFLVSLFTLPALAGTLAYVLSRDDEPWQPPGAGLLNIDDRGDVLLGVPAVGLSTGPDGDTLGVTLIDGSF